ncbi:Uncharacterised protein [Mycobacteroides abscessus subsp. abscessus]|nr:Uncharacterised protein [Mycobacteroides abscessus subsp. abscessus]
MVALCESEPNSASRHAHSASMISTTAVAAAVAEVSPPTSGAPTYTRPFFIGSFLLLAATERQHSRGFDSRRTFDRLAHTGWFDSGLSPVCVDHATKSAMSRSWSTRTSWLTYIMCPAG